MAERREKADTAAPRKRALVSCDRCKLRRARCIRSSPDEPCADCKMSGVQCESKLPRKQRVYGSVETLSLRYRALEALVKGLFPQENTQDTNTLFKLAAARNISMPATDDFTPADIFSNKDGDRSTSSPQTQGHSQSSLSQSQFLHLPSPQNTSMSNPSVGTESPASSSKDNPLNPFADVRQPSQQVEELIPTRHGTAHYFGPSSTFRLATTIRALTARCKKAQGADFPGHPSSGSPTPERAERARLERNSTNPSDEEYTVLPPLETFSSAQGRRGSKRSRSHMEETEHWDSGTLMNGTVAGFLPSRTLADALAAAFFDAIHVDYPIFNRSMFQYKLEQLYARSSERLSSCAEKGWIVSLSLVFAFGCQLLEEHDPEQANSLYLKYTDLAKGSVQELLKTSSIANVQALVLLATYQYRAGQRNTCWLVIGIAARMAISMGMHRDSTNLEFEPLERNLRRQVWWCIYVAEKVTCNTTGRPSAIDDGEVSMKLPDGTLIEQSPMAVELMGYTYKVVKLAHTARRLTYFDKDTAEERSPTLDIAERLLTECDNLFATVPPNLLMTSQAVPTDHKTKICFLNTHYYYTRCIISRDFLIQKVERHICYLENRPPPYLDDTERTFALSEDCIESAHRILQITLAGENFGLAWTDWQDWFITFHSILVVCADFLARPKDQRDSPKDIERKETVRATLRYCTTRRKIESTYHILNQIAVQFAFITGVTNGVGRQPVNPSQERQPTPGVDMFTQLSGQLNAQDDWFASATSKMGLDFFDVDQAIGATTQDSTVPPSTYQGYYTEMSTSDVDDWTSKTLRGMHSL